jgi:hypothetical protein
LSGNEGGRDKEREVEGGRWRDKGIKGEGRGERERDGLWDK